MLRRTTLFFAAVLALASAQSSVLDCLVEGPEGCLEMELSRTVSRAENIPVLRFSRHLSIITTSKTDEANENNEKETTLERLERYLYGHALRLELPQELVSGARGILPDKSLESLPSTLVVPLAEEDLVQGRGIMKKVILPFLLGLKFKTTAVIPIAIGLIALKTWKALTLALLSMVLSAALVIFRLTRPKVLNYEVVYPPHPHHHIVDEHYHGRSSDLPYRGYL